MTRSTAVVAALLVSVSVNLLVLGIVIGRKSNAVQPEERAPMEWATRELDGNTKRLVQQEMRSRTADVRPIRRDMLVATRGVRKAITARDYDPAALDDALARLRDASGRYQEFIHGSLVSLSAELTREQRIALARAAIQRGQAVKIPSEKR